MSEKAFFPGLMNTRNIKKIIQIQPQSNFPSQTGCRNGKNHQKSKKSDTSRNMTKLAIHLSTRGL